MPWTTVQLADLQRQAEAAQRGARAFALPQCLPHGCSRRLVRGLPAHHRRDRGVVERRRSRQAAHLGQPARARAAACSSTMPPNAHTHLCSCRTVRPACHAARVRAWLAVGQQYPVRRRRQRPPWSIPAMSRTARRHWRWSRPAGRPAAAAPDQYPSAFRPLRRQCRAAERAGSRAPRFLPPRRRRCGVGMPRRSASSRPGSSAIPSASTSCCAMAMNSCWAVSPGAW